MKKLLLGLTFLISFSSLAGESIHTISLNVWTRERSRSEWIKILDRAELCLNDSLESAGLNNQKIKLVPRFSELIDDQLGWVAEYLRTTNIHFIYDHNTVYKQSKLAIDPFRKEQFSLNDDIHVVDMPIEMRSHAVGYHFGENSHMKSIYDFIDNFIKHSQVPDYTLQDVVLEKDRSKRKTIIPPLLRWLEKSEAMLFSTIHYHPTNLVLLSRSDSGLQLAHELLHAWGGLSDKYDHETREVAENYKENIMGDYNYCRLNRYQLESIIYYLQYRVSEDRIERINNLRHQRSYLKTLLSGDNAP